jgi:3-isopropylmalate/(R)-2-methylmalate dehydratase small subunit
MNTSHLSRLRSAKNSTSSGEARQSAEGATAASLDARAIAGVSGRGLPMRGDDIDTDRIMPARFLVSVSFEGLERHVFEDDRAADPGHPFNDPRYRGASILVVNGNFGCGSSREHAPQGLGRFGIRAIVGESFSEIFQGNAAILGMPCFMASRGDVDRLQTTVEQTPDVTIAADVSSGTITAGTVTVDATLPPALRDAFLSGQWNPTAMLLDRFEEVRAVAERLPYIRGF